VRTDDFRVSVLIPVYNEATRIASAIESVLAQTEPPAEILVVDDGSSDGSAAVAEALGARVLVQSNAGVAHARNRLLREARFPWLAFLDADDLWYPEKLATVRAAHDAAPGVDFIISDLRCTRESGVLARESVFSETPRYRALPKRPVTEGVALLERHDLGAALAVANFIGTSTVVAQRERLLERGTLFDETLGRRGDAYVPEDVEWYLRVLRDTDVLAIARPLGVYCWRSDSLASDYARVRYGDAKLGERVVANPDAYVASAAPAFRAARRGQLRHAARLYARSGHFERARAILHEAQRDGSNALDGTALALLGFAATPAGRRLAEGLGRRR
jgi:glycosyltransferase involved in cell wall biosynthesis